RARNGGLPSGTSVQLQAADGEGLAHSPARFFGEELPLPQIPADLEPTSPDEPVAPVTVGERGGGSEQFRAAAVQVSEAGAVSVVAGPLGDANAALHRLAVIELIVS